MKILGVISYPRSGSSMMGLTLGQYEDCLYIGEISAIFYSNINRKCTCGHDGDSLFCCPVYSEVLKELLPIAKKYNYYHKDYGMDPKLKTFLFQNASKQLARNQEGDELNFIREALPVVYNIISKVSGRSILIDSSKELEYLKIRSKIFKNVYLLHVTRNPLGVIYSARKHPLHKHYEQKGISLKRSARIAAGWNAKVFLINKILKEGDVPHMKIRYEDWCIDPAGNNKKILSMVKPETDENIFNADNEFRNLESHVMRANRSSRGTGLIRIRKDSSWNKNLNKKNKLMGSIFSFPQNLLHNYL